MKIKLMSNSQEYIIEKVGVFTPKPSDIPELNSGEIVVIAANPWGQSQVFAKSLKGPGQQM